MNDQEKPPNDESSDRVDRLQRLRHLGVRRGRAALQPVGNLPTDGAQGPPANAAAHRAGRSLEDLIGGAEVNTPHGPCVVVEKRFPLDESRGGRRLGAALGLSGPAVAACAREDALAPFEIARAAFFDTETSGLAGGAGTFAFMVGIGLFETEAVSSRGPAYLVRQVFMRNPSQERALLHVVSQTLAHCTSLVSFNGRAFDAPLLTTRYLLHHEPSPLAGLLHLDLLPPARRLWRRRIGSCALGSLEREILNFERNQADVPGWLIPSLYQDYARAAGRGQENEQQRAGMASVFYHNLEDIVSMVPLAVALCSPFEPDGRQRIGEEAHPIDLLSLGQCYEALGWREEGERAYRRGLAHALPEDVRAQILLRLGWMLKRQERRGEALTIWLEWISSLPGFDPTPFVELAKHYEWGDADLHEARKYTLWGMHTARQSKPGPDREQALADLQHRLARIERKLASADP